MKQALASFLFFFLAFSLTAGTLRFEESPVLEGIPKAKERVHLRQFIKEVRALKDATEEERLAFFERQENPRLIAIALTILLGPFGAHRIYLGTSDKVPVIYALTIGGGLGVIPLIDLFHLIFAKDIGRFINNPKVIMWGD
ncbi:TM2 domain-containing protein [Sanyastnella coralliicola]|uniref:TM2 domain-containing protein n=1 Tax=Sanyastnella coralliicola TaxID=3069118 RepID=UPI0027BAC748|nr:TM2 domain-containing protein [Longitalea sp. SCSIO 12813]